MNHNTKKSAVKFLIFILVFSFSQILQAAPQSLQSPWKKIPIQAKDSLYKIFQKEGISQNQLALLKKSKNNLPLLYEGNALELQLDNHKNLLGLKYSLNTLDTLYVSKQGDKYTSQILKKPTTKSVIFKSITIEHALNTDATKAGLTPSMIKQLEVMFGGKVNFRHSLHRGDQISLLHEVEILNGKVIKTGNILAAKMTANDKAYKVVRYTNPNHHSGYYTPDGHDVNSKATSFLRSPVNFSRISSGFSYGRFDPVVHRIQPHLGIDFAAAPGTPVKSVANGEVTRLGYNGGYGKSVQIQTGSKYMSLYGHLRNFRPGIYLHKAVRKGEVIGYVGQTGWATGPHLHFGFYINGVAKNWLALNSLPKEEIGIPRTDFAHFTSVSKHLFAELNFRENMFLAANVNKTKVEG